MTVPNATPSPTSDRLSANLAAIVERIRAAARRAGRDPKRVRLVAVTKSVGADVAAALCRLGMTDLGENRAADLERKAEALSAAGLAPRWHFVGHLQRNKARGPARIASLVHSVDSVRLLETLDRLAQEAGRRLDVLLQVKLADEPTKSGLDPRDLPAALDRARSLGGVRAAGLMTMGPWCDDAEEQATRARAAFRAAAALAREHRGAFEDEPELSMGMSGDFEAAVEEGATLVRVGSSLFEGLDARGAAA